MYYLRRGDGGGGSRGRLILAAILALVALASYYGSSEVNEVTGETQRVAISPQQEINFGLQALPEMVDQFGGLSPDGQAQRMVEHVGQKLLGGSTAGNTHWRFRFTLLADANTVNAFALPGGPIFITEALYRRLTTQDQLAAVLGHEIGHVVARHGAEQMAKQRLSQQLSGAATVAAGDYSAGQMAQMVGQYVNMKYGRDDELQSDALGVRFMREAGYDPEAMIEVMKILAQASGGGRQPEFFSTHPSPDNRIARLRQEIDKPPSVASR